VSHRASLGGDRDCCWLPRLFGRRLGQQRYPGLAGAGSRSSDLACPRPDTGRTICPGSARMSRRRARRATRWSSKPSRALLELRHETLHPAPDCRWVEVQTTFGHHLGQVAQAQSIGDVPADA
jgi:hypothetical protein